MGNIGNPKQGNVGKEQGVPTKFVNRITYWPCPFRSSCSKAHYKCTVSFQTRRELTRRKHVFTSLFLNKFQSDQYNISNNKCTIVFCYSSIIQGEHKVFPLLQTFITRKTLCVEYKIFLFLFLFFKYNSRSSFYNTSVHFNMCCFCCTETV